MELPENNFKIIFPFRMRSVYLQICFILTNKFSVIKNIKRKQYFQFVWANGLREILFHIQFCKTNKKCLKH